MPVPQLTSKDNPILKTFRLLSSGARRAPKSIVIAEGIRVLEEVENSGREIEAVVVSSDFGTAPRENDLLDCWISKRVRVYRVSESLFQSISTVQTPQGAMALVRIPEIKLKSIDPPENSLLLLACGIQDPGNLGTLIRTAAAAGASLVATTKRTVSARNPKTVRSSAGLFFRLPLVEHVDVPEFRHYCALHSISMYRTDARKGVFYSEADLTSACAILLGNEGGGIAEEEFADIPAIRVPMAQGIESLNVAIAGAVILFEAFRRRLNAQN